MPMTISPREKIVLSQAAQLMLTHYAALSMPTLTAERYVPPISRTLLGFVELFLEFAWTLKNLVGSLKELCMATLTRDMCRQWVELCWPFYMTFFEICINLKNYLNGNTLEGYVPPISRTLSQIVELLWNLFDFCMDTQQVKHLITILWYYCWMDRSLYNLCMPSVRRTEKAFRL